MTIKIPEGKRALLADQARIKSLTKQSTRKLNAVWGALAKHLENPKSTITKNDIPYLGDKASVHLRGLITTGVEFEKQTYNRGFLNAPTRGTPGQYSLNTKNNLYNALIRKLLSENGIPFEEETILPKPIIPVPFHPNRAVFPKPKPPEIKAKKPIWKDSIITLFKAKTRKKVVTILHLIEDYQKKGMSTIKNLVEDPDLEVTGITEKELKQILTHLKEKGQIHEHENGVLKTYKPGEKPKKQTISKQQVNQIMHLLTYMYPPTTRRVKTTDERDEQLINALENHPDQNLIRNQGFEWKHVAYKKVDGEPNPVKTGSHATTLTPTDTANALQSLCALGVLERKKPHPEKTIYYFKGRQ